MTSECLTFANVPSFLDGRFTNLTSEPLTVAEAMPHIRVTSASEASLIAGYISAARLWVENEISTSLGARTAYLYLDYFPDDEIEWHFPPLNSVTSLQYVDSDGTTQTLSSSLYRVSTARRPPIIKPVYGQIWPVTYVGANAVTITASVGYTTPSSVPECAKQAIRYLTAMYFENREPMEEDLRVVKRTLDPIRWRGDI